VLVVAETVILVRAALRALGKKKGK